VKSVVIIAQVDITLESLKGEGTISCLLFLGAGILGLNGAETVGGEYSAAEWVGSITFLYDKVSLVV